MTEFSYQLYSSRNFEPWEDVLKMIADCGYTMVEGFGGVYTDPAKFNALLKQNGLTMPSGHFFPVEAFVGAELTNTIKTAKEMGIERLFCPAPNDDLRAGADADKWRALAETLQDAHGKLKAEGLRFGWHNHHWEFETLPDGRTPMEIILQFAPDIEWEIDVAWVVRGGADPIDWINRHADRISTAHVKDIAKPGECEDEDGWGDVGHGTMDWPSIMDALRNAGCDLFVMEHDNPNDHKRFAERSIAQAKTFKDTT